MSAAAKIAKQPKAKQKKAIAERKSKPKRETKIKKKDKSNIMTLHLNSLTWTDATPAVREKFLDGIGARSLCEAMPEATAKAVHEILSKKFDCK